MAGIQLGGLASGMDTEGVISQLMLLEAQPATRMAQNKKVSEAREQALKDILSRVKNLQTAARDLKSVTTWADTQTVESSDSTKISATRVGGAGPGGYSLSVSRLAAGDQWTYTYAPPAADTTITIKDTASPTPNTIQTIELKANMTIDEAVLAINSAADGKVYAVKVGDKLALSSRQTGDDAAFTVDPDASLTGGTRTRTAVDAEYSLDGGATKQYSASNVVKDGIAGIEFTIKTLVPDASPVTLNVSNPGADTTAVKDEIKKFVE
jgi:flagellar hook-associated protein 2